MWLFIASFILIANTCLAWAPQHRSHELLRPSQRHRPIARMQTCTTDVTLANPQYRRAFLRAIPYSIAAVAVVSSAKPAAAANLVEDLTTTAPALTLRDRVAKKLVDFPAGGLDTTDVYYPTYFKGTWECRSITKEVEAPVGIDLFGGNSTYEKALADIGTELNYKTRFRFLERDIVVADRVFNIDSITTASMGQFAVLNTEQIDGDPNHVVFYLNPSGAKGAVFRADLRVMQRRSESWTDDQGRDCFGASEVTRQTVTGSLRAPPLVKDIETTTLYTQVADGQLNAVQITCTYLVPPRQPQAAVPTDSSSDAAAAAASSTSSSSSSSSAGSAGVTTDDTVLSPALIWAANERAKWEQAGMKAIDRRVYSVTYKR